MFISVILTVIFLWIFFSSLLCAGFFLGMLDFGTPNIADLVFLILSFILGPIMIISITIDKFYMINLIGTIAEKLTGKRIILNRVGDG